MIVRMDKQYSWFTLSKRRQYLEIPIAADQSPAVSAEDSEYVEDMLGGVAPGDFHGAISVSLRTSTTTG